jgi:hypothetical protein
MAHAGDRRHVGKHKLEVKSLSFVKNLFSRDIWLKAYTAFHQKPLRSCSRGRGGSVWKLTSTFTLFHHMVYVNKKDQH